MHSSSPLFSPEPASASEYVMVVLTLLNNFHKTLRERQSQCLNKVRWGQPVIPGKHASFTIDRKHRGIRNLYDTDPSAVESADEAETEEGTKEGTVSENKDSDVIIQSDLLEHEPKEIAIPVCDQPNVMVHTEEPLKPVPSVSGDFVSSIQDDHQKPVTKRPKLGKKLGSNKENHKQKVKVHCLQRRSLFKKAQPEVSVPPVLSLGHETPDLKTKKKTASLSNNQSNGITTSLDMNLFKKSVQDVSVVLPSEHETVDQKCEQIQQESLSNGLPNRMKTLLDTNMAGFQEKNPVPCDPISFVALPPLPKECPLSDKSSSPPRTPNGENEKASPLRESNPSLNSCEIRSSSPVFSAYESPFRNSEFVSHFKDNSVTKSRESTIGSVICSMTNLVETSREHNSEPFSKKSDSEGKDFVDELPRKSKKLKKTVISKKLQKQRPLVQCPLCCEWFKPKVIETHAANCGINTPIQLDEQVNLVNSTSIPNENEVGKETCDLSRPSEIKDSEPDPPKNTDSTLEAESVAASVQNMECCPIPISNNNSEESTEQLSTSFDVFELGPVEEKSVIAFENGSTGQLQTETVGIPPEIQTKACDSDGVLKRCFICDLSYVEGKPFSTHLRSCRKNYQKLKRQFSGFSEENEEPQRKTRSRSSLATNMNNENS